jgi:hypothetical protein
MAQRGRAGGLWQATSRLFSQTFRFIVMTKTFFCHVAAVSAVTLVGFSWQTVCGQPPSADNPRSAAQQTRAMQAQGLLDESDLADQPDEEGVEYLTRGPLHEAFANPYDRDPKPNPVIDRQPPEPIDEVPPQYKPEGDDIQWIPGYWAWDEEREDFLWVSGVWRDIPPDRRWMFGYWEQTRNGYRWVDGFWGSTEQNEIAYLPVPPESIEQGPSSPSPGEEYFYIPGNWVYQERDYQWQPGYWTVAQSGWVWSPAQYYWTPRGCVYRSGYWDYDLGYRGMVFTPVYYRQNIYTQSGYRYQPRYAIDTTAALLVNLFLRPNNNRYYFGDYYGSGYANSYYPWAQYSQRTSHYDPLYAYYSARGLQQNGRTLQWVNRYSDFFQNNQRYRPPRTIAAQRDFLRSNLQAGGDIDVGALRVAAVAESLTSLVRNNDTGTNLRRIEQSRLDDFSQNIDSAMNDLVERRRTFEVSQNADRAGGQADGQPNGNNVAANANANARLQLSDAAVMPVLRDDPTDRNGRTEASDGDRAINPREQAEARRERVGQTRRNMRDIVGNGRDEVADVAEDARERGENASRNVRDRINRAREQARDGAEPGVPNLQDRMEGARDGDGLGDNDRLTPPESRDPNATERIGDAADRARRMRENDADAARETLPGAGGNLPQDARRMLENGLPGAGDANPNRGQAADADNRPAGSDDLQRRLEQLRRDGRARPQRPSDWPANGPRTNGRDNTPAIPQRGNLGGDRGNGPIPNVGGAADAIRGGATRGGATPGTGNRGGQPGNAIVPPSNRGGNAPTPGGGRIGIGGRGGIDVGGNRGNSGNRSNEGNRGGGENRGGGNENP